jgi:hypothetical protein
MRPLLEKKDMLDSHKLPDVFAPDMKIGDELLVLESPVRIVEIELVIRVTNLDPEISDGPKQVCIPLTNFENPFANRK